MPQDWFAAYVQMMPRLQAEEDLEWIHRYRVAAAMVDEQTQKQYMDERKLTAGVRRQRQSKVEILANLATIGIPVSEE